jgi:hypothetical protein
MGNIRESEENKVKRCLLHSPGLAEKCIKALA